MKKKFYFSVDDVTRKLFRDVLSFGKIGKEGDKFYCYGISRHFKVTILEISLTAEKLSNKFEQQFTSKEECVDFIKQYVDAFKKRQSAIVPECVGIISVVQKTL